MVSAMRLCVQVLSEVNVYTIAGTLWNATKKMSPCEQVLVELAIERDQDIPALIYEGRPTVRSVRTMLIQAFNTALL